MDDDKFEKYLKNSIIPLYPDALDVLGKRVIIKVDRRPGRMNIELLAELRLLGFYMYPSVPNTTVVSQETDQNYGPFKTQFQKNLAMVTDQQLEKNKSVSLQPWIVGLIVFGRTDPITGFKLTGNAFKAGFSKKACLNALAKVGAAPLTCQCLSDPNVSKSLGDGDEDFDQYLHLIQVVNDLSRHTLTEGGFNGDLIKAMIIARDNQVDGTAFKGEDQKTNQGNDTWCKVSGNRRDTPHNR
jgi:hypothetical protein